MHVGDTRTSLKGGGNGAGGETRIEIEIEQTDSTNASVASAISGSPSTSGSTPGSAVSLGSILISGRISASGSGGGGGGSPERTPREPRDTPCTGFATSRARRCSHPALFALASHPPVLADARAPHSLHWYRILPCSQMLHPPPCTGFAPSRARRCPEPRTPCTGIASSRARRSESPRTPALASLPPVHADLRAPALRTWLSLRARRCPSPALLALGSLPPVLADASPALLAGSPLPCSRSPSQGTPCNGILGRPSRAGTTDLSWALSPLPSGIACQDSRACRRVRAELCDDLLIGRDEYLTRPSVFFPGSSDPANRGNVRSFRGLSPAGRREIWPRSARMARVTSLR